MIAALVYPLPRVGDRLPVVSHEFEARVHLGVDLMYRWAPGDPITGPRVARSRSGICLFYVPLGARVLAVADGRVIYAKQADNGWRTRIETDAGLHVLDLHMTELYVHAGDRVHQGQPLGMCGGDPTDKPIMLVHDHHEHRRRATPAEKADGYGYVPYDPELELAKAVVVSDHGA